MKIVILHLITLFQELNNGIDLQSNRLYETDKIKKRPLKSYKSPHLHYMFHGKSIKMCILVKQVNL